MIKAIIKNGAIVLQDPLPTDWQEGTELVVERSSAETETASEQRLAAWMEELEASAQLGNLEDDLRLEAAIQEIRQRDKNRKRDQHGLAS